MELRKSIAAIAASLLMVGAGGIMLGASAVANTTCMVDSNGDQSNADPTRTTADQCKTATGTVTLRSAIEDFNNKGGVMNVTFSPSLPNPTTINLGSVLNITPTTATDSLTVTGAGMARTIINGQHTTALVQGAGAALTFNDLTLENGQAASSAGIAGGTVGQNGCGQSNLGDVTIARVHVTGVDATSGHVTAGAILGKHVTIQDSLIDGNTATASGSDNSYDGLVVTCAQSVISGSTIQNNTGDASPLNGYNDGIIVGNGGVTVTKSVISNNTMTAATNGVDGIFDYGGLVDISDSYLTQNHLRSPGGGTDGVLDVSSLRLVRSAVDDNEQTGGTAKFDCGVICVETATIDLSSISGNTRNYGDHAGGSDPNSSLCSEIFCMGGGTSTISNSTIGSNTVTAGINTRLRGQYVAGDTSPQNGTVLTVTNTTFARNAANLGAGSSFVNGPFNATTFVLRNSILGENTPNNCSSAIVGTVTHTLDTDGTCVLPNTNGNVSNRNAQFVGAVQVNAPGKTRTLAIAANSPAKDTADNTVCPATDQRLVSRLADDPLCDMGAYEYVRPAVVAAATPSPSATPTLPKAGGGRPSATPGLLLVLFGLVTGAVGIRAGFTRVRRLS